MRIHPKLRTSVAAAALLIFSETAAPPASAQATAGPVFNGAPDLRLAMDFIAAGGGAGDFSSVRALDELIGAPALQAELQKLSSIYGPGSADRFVRTFDYAINDAWIRAGQHNLKMPQPSGETGRTLAARMIRAGTAPDGAFWGQFFFDRTLSQPVAADVLSDADYAYGSGTSTSFLRMADQFFYDVSQQIGTSVALAPLH